MRNKVGLIFIPHGKVAVGGKHQQRQKIKHKVFKVIKI